MADDITLSGMLGSIVGEMLSLRDGKRVDREQQNKVVYVVMEKVGEVRELFAKLRAENEELRARHNPEVCVDTQEYCDRLKEELSAIKAAARSYIAAHSLTAVRLQDAGAAEQYTKAAVDLEEMIDA